MIKGAIAVTIACSLLSGCAGIFSVGDSTYGCTGLPEGVRCMSARDVYAATEHADQLSPTGSDVLSDTKSAQVAPMAASRANPGARSGRAPVIETEREIPIRTPAQVMRVWIAPWEDTAGILHASEYLFKEIEGRRWSVGNRAALSGAVSPLGDTPSSQTSNPLKTR